MPRSRQRRSGASGDNPPRPAAPDQETAPIPPAPDDQADGADDASLGEELATRDRRPADEARGRDALDNAVQLGEATDLPDDIALDAAEEIAALPGADEYETTDSGARRPADDDAEMGFGAEPRSIEELADSTIGDAIPGRRGTTREGEAHGPDLGLR